MRVETQDRGGKIPELNEKRDRVLKELFCKNLPKVTITNASALDVTPEEFAGIQRKNAKAARNIGQIDPVTAARHTDG